MAFEPTGTKWSVAELNDDGTLGKFDPTPWEFNHLQMNAGSTWAGTYKPVAGVNIAYDCDISTPDTFQVVFVTADRFIATKAGKFYRFGKKL